MGGIAIKILGSLPIASVQDAEKVEFCFCGIDCADDYVEKAFTGSASDEDWKKDKASFLLRKLRDADTIAFEIWKDSAKVADITDSSFGTYYDTFTAQPLYVGFIADWSAIQNAFGIGHYQIKAQKTILGQSTTFESRNYWVLPYDEETADGTVRFETFTTGNILRSEFDYDSLIEGGWYQSIRLPARFGNVTPSITTDKIQTSDRQVVSVQDKIENQITLFTDFIGGSLKKQLTNDQLLNNRCLITDYNLLNDEVIRQKNVYLSEVSRVEHSGRTTSYELLFLEENDNLVIRNF